jgi:hypothetical protein
MQRWNNDIQKITVFGSLTTISVNVLAEKVDMMILAFILVHWMALTSSASRCAVKVLASFSTSHFNVVKWQFCNMIYVPFYYSHVSYVVVFAVFFCIRLRQHICINMPLLVPFILVSIMLILLRIFLIFLIIKICICPFVIKNCSRNWYGFEMLIIVINQWSS